MTPTLKRGRPGKHQIGSTIRVLINGDEGGLPLLATVVRNSPALVVTIAERDPIWHGCRLGESQFRVAAVLSQRVRQMADEPPRVTVLP